MSGPKQSSVNSSNSKAKVTERVAFDPFLPQQDLINEFIRNIKREKGPMMHPSGIPTSKVYYKPFTRTYPSLSSLLKLFYRNKKNVPYT
jgi:hypothetical protein